MNIRTVNTNITKVKFQNNHVVYENFIKCSIKDYEFNLSYNPTLLSGSQAVLFPFSSSLNGDVFYNITGSKYFGILKDYVTGSISGSEFSPYVTAVGLYNDAQELLAIAKMSAPIPISSNSDMTFLVKYDTQWTPKPYFTPSPTPSTSPAPSLTPSVTPTATPSITPSISVTPSVSRTPSVTPSATTSVSVTPSISVTPSVTPSISVTPSTTPSISVTPSVTPSTTPPLSYYYYSARRFDCGSGCAQVSPDVVVRSSTSLSTLDGVYYKPLGSFTYQLQTEVSGPSFNVDISGAPSNANCTTACSL